MGAMEIWKDIPGTDYSISNEGDVASRKGGGWRILRPSIIGGGYRCYNLWVDGESVAAYSHRLIAAAFVGPAPTPKHEVNHRDGNKRNNAPENLEWVTHKQNLWHAAENLGVMRGKQPNAKLNPEKVIAIREMRARGASMAEISQTFGISQGLASLVWRGKEWAWVK